MSLYRWSDVAPFADYSGSGASTDLTLLISEHPLDFHFLELLHQVTQKDILDHFLHRSNMLIRRFLDLRHNRHKDNNQSIPYSGSGANVADVVLRPMLNSSMTAASISVSSCSKSNLIPLASSQFVAAVNA